MMQVFVIIMYLCVFIKACLIGYGVAGSEEKNAY